MRPIVWSAITGTVATWAVYTIFYGVVYTLTGDIHIGWAVIAGLAMALVAGIFSGWKIYRWLKPPAPASRS